jgi:Arc/MetJ-type ribon-helix-helix transcriptional regulator
MQTSVQARLDEETQAALDRLVRRHGLSTSEVVREGIRLMDEKHKAPRRPKLIGVGMFDSGIPDLATSKKYMEDFGRKSLGKGSRK